MPGSPRTTSPPPWPSRARSHAEWCAVLDVVIAAELVLKL
jgi:hypothetical protein